MRVKVRKLIVFLLASQMVGVSLAGCVPATVEEGGTTIDATPENPIATQPIPGSSGAVCNPFGGGSAGLRDQGLKGQLYYLPENLPKYQNVSEYIENGTKLNANLFFDQVNVPTRPFDAGFVTTGGEVMKTPAGDTLYEWFGIRFESKIRLTNQDAPGKYQFALLADDGAVLFERNTDGSFRTIVNNDGQHATKLKVSREPVVLGANDELPIELRYYQGPRMHIAAMLLWREWPEAADAYKDPLDGKEGNDLFFSSGTQPSTPLAAYQQLLARGWRPVPAANFFLPNEAPANPCPEAPAQPEIPPVSPPTAPTEPTAPTIPAEPAPVPVNDLRIQSFDGTTTGNSASLIWSTPGVPSTTTIYYGTSADNLDRSLSLGSVRSEVHTVTVPGLNPQTVYYFRAESRDAAGRVVRSDVLMKLTK